MARVRTLNFLPEVFQTPTNAEFLAATLDQITSDPVTRKVQGYVGSRLGPGVNALDYYVTEPDKTRTDYQLEPGVVFTKPGETVAKDFISYPGIIDAIKLQDGITTNNNRLFESQFYSWDSFTDLDKLVNYYQYYWLPNGLPAVTVAPSVVYTSQDYIVTNTDNAYGLSPVGAEINLGENPTLTLLRGGTYTFTVNQDAGFWIQTDPGTSGFSPIYPNIPTREVYGVDNNGAEVGVVTFNVPYKTDQDDYIFPGNNPVDLVCTVPFEQIDGQLLHSFVDPNTGVYYPGVEQIDGVSGLENRTVMFYNTGVYNEVGYVSAYYNETFYDENDPNITANEITYVASTSSVDNSVNLASGYSTSGLVVNQTVTFANPIFGGLVAGQVYFVKQIIDSNSFTVSEYIDGPEVTLSTSSASTINATAMVAGQTYVIVTAGTTDYTTVGAASNTVGTVFVATGPALGTGTVLFNAMVGYINQGEFEQGFYTNVSENFYQIKYVGDPNNPVLRLIPVGVIPNQQNIIPQYGTQWINRPFYRNTLGVISLVPIITANKDILYYQDGSNPNKVGIFKIVDANINNFINVDEEILGRTSYTSPNGVTLTNGLKVIFDGNVYPSNYLEGEYYVEGVGTGIELISTDTLICTEDFSIGEYVPWDTTPYDVDNFDIQLYLPVDPDYITIARNSISRNAWSRSNRWFHEQVISATATYNGNPSILTEYAKQENKAKRPIIEFYPNLKLFDSGIFGKNAVDFFDTRDSDALSNVAGLNNYYPDVETYTSDLTATVAASPTTIVGVASMVEGVTYTITLGSTTQSVWNELAGTDGVVYVDGNTITCQVDGSTILVPGSGTGQVNAVEATIVIPLADITGVFQTGMYVGDTLNKIPLNSQITAMSDDGTDLTLTVSYPYPENIAGGVTTLVGSDTLTSNYAVFPGARIVFASDSDSETVGKIYVVDIVSTTTGSQPTIVLTEAEDAAPIIGQQVAVSRGYNYKGFTFYYDGISWSQAQQKVTVNQAPKFDVFDSNGISFGDTDIYNSSTFRGCTLFSYGIGTSTIDDPVLGFPVRYSAISNENDLSFDVTLNSQTFDYVSGFNSYTKSVNDGYVYNYTSPSVFTREIGWETAVEPSVQYQVFTYNYDILDPITEIVCDIPIIPLLDPGEEGWPRVQVYYNNEYVEPTEYTVAIYENGTGITLINPPEVSTVIQVLLLSNQVSNSAYYMTPINLNNNPLNADITIADLGDIKMQYQDIFINAPNTTGQIFGSNNFRDCGNLVPYGTKIIQNSASLALPGAFLRHQNHSLLNSLLFNSREYIKYKQLLVYTVQNTDYVQRYTPSAILDDAIEQISASKSEYNSFFWSDMLPNKAPFIVNTYTFNSNMDTTIYPLSQVYNFASANYNGVLVYLYRIEEGIVLEKQLLRNIDYTVSEDSPSLTVTLDLLPGDKVIIKEYNQTYGSYVPYTPSKLGLYPAFEPSVVLDDNYQVPTYFIKGHDGSYTKLYGQYIPETDTLVDYRDQALLEFEKRVFNNVKLSTEVPIKLYDVIPGYFRDSDYSYSEWLQIYTPGFLNWVGQNRLDYKTQFYNRNNEWTYNYTNAGNKLDKAPIQQGYWRGLYQYFYDTTTPNTTPWEMLGFANEPTWWQERYGPAPYTSDNLVLWSDLASGLVYSEDGTSIVIPEVSRPGLLDIIPVDTYGNLKTPMYSIVGAYNPNTFKKDWKVGDDGPVELSYRRSSSYPYDVIRMFALTKPAEFYNLAVDLDNYKYNAEFNQYLVNDRSHLIINDVEIYGNGTAKTSYINWIVDYEKQFGVDATSQITELLDNLDVRLVYRMAGFSDKTLLNFYVEKGSPNSANASLLIPDESYSILLYDNQPNAQLVFSAVTVQQTTDGWLVFGNSQLNAYFPTLTPVFSGNNETITVVNQTVKVTKDFSSTINYVPYGTKFYTAQDLSQFLMNYAAYLQSNGMLFQEIEYGFEINWTLMVQEFLYWTQTGWEDGSIVTLNPAATKILIDKPSNVVQPLTLQQQNFVLNQDLYPISLTDLCVNRDGNIFSAHPLNDGDALSYAQFNMSNIEHGVVFNNTTLFNDVIYNLTTGLRQNRIYLRGTKSAEWNGTVDAWGFVLNQDNVKEWSRDIKYPKGIIVKYKNKYWTSLTTIQPSSVFEELNWKEINYNDVQKGLLPNSATRSYESTLYYNCNEANLENDADLLSFSLIGYRPRDYMALADLTDITQINVYKNMIKNKGTRNASLAFKGATLPQGGIEYDVYENWAILRGEYGGVLNDNYVEFRLDQNTMTGNPAIVSLTNGVGTTGAQQEVPLYDLYNYSQYINDPNILSTTSYTGNDILYPSAGYANFDDVRMSSFFFAGLPNAVDKTGRNVPIQDFYVRDYLWLANYKEKWGIYTWKPINEVVLARPNLNGTTTITFSEPHNLTKYDAISIVNFANNVDGYYIVLDIVNLNEVIINLNILNSTGNPIQGRGVGVLITSQRVDKPSDIGTIDLLETDFQKNTVWVNENNDGNWAVYRKSLNYQSLANYYKNGSSQFGYSVGYNDTINYIISDPTYNTDDVTFTGRVYRYNFNEDGTNYEAQVITEGDSFGTKIVHADNVVVISEPTSVSPSVRVYVKNQTVITDDIIEVQEIAAPVGVTDWGTELAISDDKNWLYISDFDNVTVYVYRRDQISLDAGYFTVGQVYTITEVGDTDWEAIGAVEATVGITFVATGVGSGTGVATQVTYQNVNTIDASGSPLNLLATDKFGYSIATDYYGDTLFISAPFVDDVVEQWGKAYFYQRTTQTFEAPSNSLPYQAQYFTLAYTPDSESKSVTNTNLSTNKITLSSVTSIAVNDPVIFTGSGLNGTGIAVDKVYYIASIVGSDITIKESRSTTTEVDITLTSAISNTTATVQTTPLYVTVNGTSVADSNYAVSGNKFIYTETLNAGDIIVVSGNDFYLTQEFNSNRNDRVGFQFGYSLDTTIQGAEVLFGSPYEINEENKEGIVYRYTNGGAKYGIVTGTIAANVTATRTLLINGYAVNIPVGNASTAATAINANNITNIEASSTTDGRLIIQLINYDLGVANEKLLIAAYDNVTLDELGIIVYTNTQEIVSPRAIGPTEFGKAIKFNEYSSVVIGAPAGTEYVGTTFDFSDDENLHNDTVFDNNATRFVDSYPNAGAVYMFDLLTNYNSSLTNPGAFVYAQSTNSGILDFTLSPMYGSSVDFYQNNVIVGAPDYEPATIGGGISAFINNVGAQDWAPYRQPSAVVDIERIMNSQIFSALTNNTLINLDYMDPAQGKLLGVVRENIDFVSKIDPAYYNSDPDTFIGRSWGPEHVGMVWLNTTNLRFVDYHQNDVTYNASYWGTLFPGSDVAVYTWVASNVLPSSYPGPGTPYDVTQYCVGSTLNASNIVTPVYYFWARNTGIVDDSIGKTLADTNIAQYIANPLGSGISYMAPVLPNTFALYNSTQYINANDSVFHIGYANGESDDVSHNEFSLIRENYPDDFLPGFPTIAPTTHNLAQHGSYNAQSVEEPYSLYARFLDSLSGCSVYGGVVPDPLLPPAVQSGVLVRPRQSFFYNRFTALRNYITYANEILAQYPITELKPDLSFLFLSGEFYDTTNYWSYINWWAPGYNDNVRPAIQVPLFADLAGLVVAQGTLAKVEQNGQGFWEIYRYDGSDVWSRVGLENGTIEFSSSLYEYGQAMIGFSGDFFDTTPYDTYPSTETRNIIRALNEQIYTGDLISYRNKSLVLIFEYIQSETVESQNYLPWLSKTSLIDVGHTIRELRPYEVYKSDNDAFLEGYINEVKPYHVVMKDYLVKYTGGEIFEGDITDFDLPATYNSSYQEYITPQLVYTEPSSRYQYKNTNSIWSTAPYTQWYQNYGLSIGQAVYQQDQLTYVGDLDYAVTTLKYYIDLGTRYMIVDNANGLPINGVIKLGEEYINYTYVDRELNLLGNLTRGLYGSPVTEHLPGEAVVMDLPSILVLDGGNNYLDIPQVTAYIDTTIYPAPRKEAILQPVMSGDKVTSILVIEPGDGYAVLPEIQIEPAYKVYFSNTDINSTLHTVGLFAPLLQTGDLVRFHSGTNGNKPNKLVDGGWYYVNVLETIPQPIIAFYTNYSDAVNDHNRIPIEEDGQSNDMYIAPGARASLITSSLPIRENNIKIKFDRTTYTSQVIDWESGAFYGAFFAGTYNNSTRISSSSITLENTEPDINTILSSAQGLALEVVDVENDQVVEWSSFVRYVSATFAANNSIKLIPQDGNNPDLSELEPNASGTTIGFYEGMPIKFVGAVTGGLADQQVYYVKTIIDELYFTVSATVDGPVVTLTNGTVSTQGLECYVGEVTNTAVLTVNYPGILNVTATASVTNTLTVPLNESGSGGTSGFYTNLPVFFVTASSTDPMLGGLVENQVYYITTVVDNETFTISEKKDPVQVDVTETTSSTDTVTVSTTLGFAINDPIIFTDLTSTLATSNIVAGQTYYIREIVGATDLIISEEINGSAFALNNGTGTGTLTNQKDTVSLTSTTGLMLMDVNLPVSPGQVNGQLFSLYTTSNQYPNIISTDYRDIIERTIRATITGVNRVSILETEGGTENFYSNMPFEVSTSMGGLTSSTTYYVLDYSGMEDPLNPGEYIPNIEILATNTSSVGNIITCKDVDGYIGTVSLYVGMPIKFSGQGLGGIVVGQQYFVDTIVSTTEFTITDVDGGSTFILENAGGTMLGTGTPYITVSTTPGGSEVALTTDYATVSTLTQTPDPGGANPPEFDLSYILGGYRAIIINASTGFAIDNSIVIPGTAVGGTSPENDITLYVNTIDEDGGITSLICQGTVPDSPTQYYLKVRSLRELEVYSDPLMQVPVSGIDFPYTGYTSATVTTVVDASNAFTITDTSIFSANDAVVFTGDVISEVTLGRTYYIYSILSSTTFTVTTIPGDAASVVNITANQATNFTVAKLGSMAFLPEPFYFNQSIVKYNNRVWVCVVSNNDDEFILGKWDLLDSGDRRLNAMDRTIGYYQPTVNMPGVDLQQLFEGVTYPNSIYRGNAFQPDQQYPVDVILQDQPFYPTDVSITSVVYDGTRYLASANMPMYSSVLFSEDSENWDIGKLTNTNILLTDIIYADGYYLMTSNNPTTPIFRSNNGTQWSTNGYFTPYGVDYDTSPYDSTSISVAGLTLNSIGFMYRSTDITVNASNLVYGQKYIIESVGTTNFVAVGASSNTVGTIFTATGNTTGDGTVALVAPIFVAVGENIVVSDNTYNWTQITNFTPSLQYSLHAVSYADITGFTGLITVGKGKSSSSGSAEDINLIFYSTDSVNWNQVPTLTTKGLYAVASNATKAIAVGENGVIYYTENAANWLGLNEVECTYANSSSNVLNVSNTTGFAVNDPVKFTTTFSSIVAGTTYYIDSIVSSTQITLSDSSGGPTKSLTLATAPAGTRMYSYAANAPALRDIIYAHNTWIAVGDEGTIITSSDGITWTTRTSGTAYDINGITYDSTAVSFTAVGDNNVILVSDDDGVTWTESSLFTVAPTLYDIQGANFQYGYGPEELVPGVVSDNLAVIVNTRAGTNWNVVEYGHTGFSASSIEHTPSSGTQVTYSFANLAQVPAQIQVQVIDGDSSSASYGLGTTLYPTEYTVDWVNKTITLDTPLSYSPVLDKLRIDVYEVGNGDQLIKASTDSNPIRTNTTTGFNEIYLNCNYNATIYEGSGVMRPGTDSINIKVTETTASSDRITCESVSDFVLNSPITFQGLPFGNLEEDTIYYVKTVSTATNTITISASYDYVTGIAGPTFELTDATGEMYANIQNGAGVPWSDPYVYHNGTKLLLGGTGLASRTKAAPTNTITIGNTSGMIVDSPITFGLSAFGVLDPLTTYYIKSIVDGNEFTISATPGGAEIALTDATGAVSFVTNDFAFATQPNGISAKMILASGDYENNTDYIVYSLLGETTPEQYGYAVPEVQYLTGDGSTDTFDLNNFVGYDNPTNAIVEIDGVRQTASAYTISSIANNIVFGTAPSNGSTIMVMTYNDTNRQYLTSQYGITGDTVAPIVNITNAISPPIAVTYATSTTAPSTITFDSTTGFVVDQTIQFVGTSFGSILTDGTVYYIASIAGSTCTLKDGSGSPVTVTTAVGNMQAIVGGTPAVRVTTSIDHNFTENTLVRIDGTLGSVQLNNNVYYAKIISPTRFDLYTEPYDPSVSAVNSPVTSISAYTSGGYTWRQGQYFITTTTATATASLDNRITVSSIDDLVEGTPVYFSETETPNDTVLMGGLVQGQKYYIKTIDIATTTISVSETQYGDTFVVTNDTGSINVTQWAQEDIDRVWVTINGYRVPASKITLNNYNELGILSEITSGDTVIITSMIPSATPDQEAYINYVNTVNEPSVYRISPEIVTWLTAPIYELSTTISIHDVAKVTRQVVQTETVPSLDNGYYYIGLNADKRIIANVKVYNNNTSAYIDSSYYSVVLVDMTPTLRITPGAYVAVGASLTITTLEGNTIYVNGEEIRFGTVDFNNNTLGQITRGVNGTAQQTVIPNYTAVYGMLSVNQLPQTYYDNTWNSYIYNTVEGDPLQVSETAPAVFLNTDIT